jgi:hypothetical protein
MFNLELVGLELFLQLEPQVAAELMLTLGQVQHNFQQL